MGQPIRLVKGNDTMTVYGRHQAAVHMADGWRLQGDGGDLAPSPVVWYSVRQVADDAGVPHVADALLAAGYATADEIIKDSDGLTAVSGVGKATARKLLAAAQELVNGD